MITYDVVTNPSHAKARILEFLPESVGNSNDDENYTYLNESSDIILALQQDRVNISQTSINEKNFIDDILKENFSQSLKKIKFNF